LKIGLAQFNPKIGDFEQNTHRILQFIEDAKKKGVELVVFPELAVCGYPPRDILDFHFFVEGNLESVEKIARAASGISVICGYVAPNPNGVGRPFFNSAAVLQNGKQTATYHKQLLPYYDIFDEERYFEPGKEPCVFKLGSLKIALTICEDLWNVSPYHWRPYPHQPLDALKKQKPDLVLNISASPFNLGKPKSRVELFKKVGEQLGSAMLFCNLVGGNDDLVFDGCSFGVSERGKVVLCAKAFEEQLLVVDSDLLKKDFLHFPDWPESQGEWLFEAIRLGIKDYVKKCGATGVYLGLSGGIDSSVTAAIAVAALGNEAVAGICLPTRYTDTTSIDDAKKLAENLGIQFRTSGIETILRLHESLFREWYHVDLSALALENLQPRIRMTILMAVSNQWHRLLLNTSNKSEIATGYATLYGDTSGALSPLGDITKDQVHQIARYINRSQEIIPERVFTKPPSAELRANQTDQDTLPPYEVLDRIVEDSIEGTLDKEQLIKKGHPKEWVEKFEKLHTASEHKRRQLPPVVRVSSRAFGIGRRIPITANRG